MNSLDSFADSFTVLVQGASRGIGLGFVKALAQHPRVGRIVATCRDPDSAAELLKLKSERVQIYPLDVCKPESIAALAQTLSEQDHKLHLFVNAAGVLHGNELMPEKKIEELDLQSLQQVFAVNAFGPALMMQALRPLMVRKDKAVMCAISARVGSISDNRLGGWYAYRASKSALNQLLRTASIELKRRNPNVIVAALHPGTTDTGLSKPFQARVPAEKLFSVAQTCDYLLEVINKLTIDDSGGFFAWDGQAIDW